MAYTFAQLETVWINAGGSSVEAPIAAAVAMAESSGNAAVTSGNPDGGTNVGLWQLDTPGGKGAGYSVSQLQDPETNAKVAIAGSNNGKDWSAWETYVTGAYRQFLSNVSPAALTAASGGVTGSAAGSAPAASLASFLTGIPNEFADFFTLFHNLISPTFWLRIGAGIVGISLLALGVYILVRADSPQGSSMPNIVPIPV